MTQPHHLLTTRLHRRPLGLTPPLDLPGGTLPRPLETLVCPREVRGLLRRLLAATGQGRGGLLVGTRTGETLHLAHVLPASYSWWLPEGDPFAVDALRNDSEPHWTGSATG